MDSRPGETRRDSWPAFADREIIAARPPKNAVDSGRPYAFLVEPERTAAGRIEDVATIFLTNRECPFRCLYCDLWKNTTDQRVPLGAIPAQIDFALQRLPPARHVKLYNSGNFFDAQAIPPEDHPAIADRVRGFSTVIVENHPKLCGDHCLAFRDRLKSDFEVALGLETANPAVLARLNKQMTVADFERAAKFLVDHGIRVRTFILLKLPGMSESEGIEWAVRSMEVAFAAGSECCSIIPTRTGNGMLDQLAADGFFAPPRLSSLESVLEAGLSLGRGRVFVDLWDSVRFGGCERCRAPRRERLQQMNLRQQHLPPIPCHCSEPVDVR